MIKVTQLTTVQRLPPPKFPPKPSTSTSPELYNALKADVWALGTLFTALSLQEYPWPRAKVTDFGSSVFVQDPFDTLFVHPPVESRHVISHILKMEPMSRVDLHDIFDDPIQEVYKIHIY